MLINIIINTFHSVVVYIHDYNEIPLSELYLFFISRLIVIALWFC